MKSGKEISLFDFLLIGVTISATLITVTLCDQTICKEVKRKDLNKPRNDFSPALRLPQGFDRGHIIGKVTNLHLNRRLLCLRMLQHHR